MMIHKGFQKNGGPPGGTRGWDRAGRRQGRGPGRAVGRWWEGAGQAAGRGGRAGTHLGAREVGRGRGRGRGRWQGRGRGRKGAGQAARGSCTLTSASVAGARPSLHLLYVIYCRAVAPAASSVLLRLGHVFAVQPGTEGGVRSVVVVPPHREHAVVARQLQHLQAQTADRQTGSLSGMQSSAFVWGASIS